MTRKQIYNVIKRFSEKYPISKMCLFYNVSTSGYYDWLKRVPDEKSDEDLRDTIIEAQKKHKGRLGYRRVVKYLFNKDIIVNHKRVLRVMRKYNLLSKVRRQKHVKYKLKGNLKYENIMNKEFTASKPNQRWCTDISYIITPEGTLYLSSIRDLYDDFIVGWQTSTKQDYALVRQTIDNALIAEKPQEQVLLHSDGGGQFRSFEYHRQTKRNGITPSMSKPGTPGDNSPAENFFSTFKCECIYMEKPETIEMAREMTNEFMEYYCYERIQDDGRTPWERRKAWLNENSK